MIPKALETDTLLLRHTDKQDSEDFSSLVSLPAFGKLSPFGSVTKENAGIILDSIIKNYENEAYDFWTVVDKKNNTYAGFVGYQPVVFENQSEEMFFIGFYRKFWGSELPLSASKMVCEHVFKKGRISRLIAFVHPEDVESIYIAQSLGSQFEKQTLFFDATVLLFSLTPSVLTAN